MPFMLSLDFQRARHVERRMARSTGVTLFRATPTVIGVSIDNVAFCLEAGAHYPVYECLTDGDPGQVTSVHRQAFQRWNGGAASRYIFRSAVVSAEHGKADGAPARVRVTALSWVAGIVEVAARGG
ncbi:MAG: hypothetical protein FD165_1595 [Gammaproteobacteria bacterium]|nr:MAG: hypothetical protein FD165_1595 [Gammaproteobacteria bacterium]